LYPGYSTSTFYANDIALLQIGAVTYSSTVAPICLPPPSWATTDMTGKTGIATGWGGSSTGANNYTSQMGQASMTFISNADCAKIYGSTVITSNTICAQGSNGQDVCKYDGGGPLQIKASDNLYHIEGVISFFSGKGCGTGQPSAFTAVPSFDSWISNTTGISTTYTATP
jgi:secreted trypsin-like serine protease